MSKIIGKSGKEYYFDILPLGSSFPEESGIYILSKLFYKEYRIYNEASYSQIDNSLGYDVLYIDESNNFALDIPKTLKQQKNNVTHIGIMLIPDEYGRVTILKDLKQNYKLD